MGLNLTWKSPYTQFTALINQYLHMSGFLGVWHTYVDHEKTCSQKHYNDVQGTHCPSWIVIKISTEKQIFQNWRQWVPVNKRISYSNQYCN